MRFRTKLFFICSLVVLLLWGGTMWPIQRMIRSSFSRLADENFADTRDSLHSAQAEQMNRLHQAAKIVMEVPELRALIAEDNFEISPDNLASLQERIDNLAGIMSVKFVCVLDGRGTLIAQNTGAPWAKLSDLKNYLSQSPQAKPLIRQLFEPSHSPAGADQSHSGLWVYRGRLYQVVGLPLVFSSSEDAPATTDGALIVATLVTDELADNLSKNHDCEISFLAEGGVMASSLDSKLQPDLLKIAGENNWQLSTPFDATMGGMNYRSYMEPLVDPCSKAIVGTMVIQNSLAEGNALLATVSHSLLAIMAAGLCVAALVSFMLSTAITRPVHQLVDGARRVAAGDLECSLNVTRHDELGELATAFNDMVVQLRTRRELQRLVDESQAANKAKSQFLANMSHEIRTPLHGVIGMANLLLTTELNGRQRHFAELVKSSTEVLTTLINDILDFSKIEAGKLELESVAFNLHTVVEDVVELLSQKAFGKGVDMLCDIAGDVPTMVSGDTNRLRQILMNLAGNAVKFTESGEIIVRVQLERVQDGRAMIAIAVTDTGMGIPPDRLDRLFKSFSQVDTSTTRRYGGTGLGLAICKQLVELMGGTIGVKSEVGHGSTFHFTAGFEQLDAPVANSPDEFGNVRALVVDDRSTSRMIIQRQLRELGIRATNAASAAEGAKMLFDAKAAGEDISVVLIDRHVDGYQIVTSTPGPKFILKTIADQAMNAQDLAAGNFSASIVKPVRKSHLRDAVATAMGLKIARTERPAEELIIPAAGSKPFRILVAEDNEVNQAVAIEFLKQAGYHSKVVSDGNGALQALLAEPYDLVLMDCQMPVMDGLEATRAYRKHEEKSAAAGGSAKRVPIIALTANASGADRGRCRDAGMDGYCGKPFKPKELLRIIAEFLAQSNSTAPVQAKAPEPAKESSDKPAFDVATFIEGCSGNRELAENILDKFQKQMNDAMVEMEKCLAEHNALHLSRVSHSLKGTAGLMAAESLRLKFAEMEQLGKANTLDHAEECLQRVREEVKRCIDQIPRVRSELKEIKQ